MAMRILRVVACLLACAGFASAQDPAAPDAGITRLVADVQDALERHDEAALRALTDPAASPDQVTGFVASFVDPAVQRAVVRERDRVPLEPGSRGQGYRLILEAFVETAERARIVNTLVDVHATVPGGDSWHITAAQGLTSVDGLYRLRVDTEQQFAARDLVITAHDLRLTMREGTVFKVEVADGVTGLVLLGRGEMQFSPTLPTEQGQLRIFSGAEALTAAFDSVFVRLNPVEFERRVAIESLQPVAVDQRQARRAEALFAREGPKSFSLDLSELSPGLWYLLPAPGDFLAEVRTRRHGTLTYSRSTAQAEDVSVFDRERKRTISVYPSIARAAASASFNEDQEKQYDVLDYNVIATIAPERQYIDGVVRMRIRVQANDVSSLTLRLADSLTVKGIASVEHGRLMPLRLRNQHTIIVSLPVPLQRDEQLTMVVSYAGQLESQEIDAETLQISDAPPPPPTFQDDLAPFMAAERNFLLSNRSFWYPQNSVPDYATASLRITVPAGYGCVASGDLGADNDVTLRDLLTSTIDGRAFVFRAADPLRYLAVVVSRFVRVGEASVRLPTGVPGSRESIRVAVDANPRQQARGRQLFVEAQNILSFYAGIVGDAPYAAATVAVVEDELPGGHSPGYFAVVNNPLPYSPFVWRNDPAAFQGFPDFFVAHELAHQWWGQAVGWRNYHEQWLSEGFAQYFAALWARESRGESVFVAMLRQIRRWALAESDEGPISLGYRLGHIKGDARVFRALVYNKSAGVLHMLRRTVGDEVFFAALRRFYTEYRFQKAGTEDLRRVFEAESGRSLERFFIQWIYGAAVPRLRYTTAVGGGSVTVRFEETTGTAVDLPVTVTVLYTDGHTQDVIVQISDSHAEARIPVTGAVRQVQVNRDFAALAYFEQR